MRKGETNTQNNAQTTKQDHTPGTRETCQTQKGGKDEKASDKKKHPGRLQRGDRQQQKLELYFAKICTTKREITSIGAAGSTTGTATSGTGSAATGKTGKSPAGSAMVKEQDGK